MGLVQVHADVAAVGLALPSAGQDALPDLGQREGAQQGTGVFAEDAFGQAGDDDGVVVEQVGQVQAGARPGGQQVAGEVAQ
ncbi:hypothetical protein [Salinactinospora qingdaonensis]|uniref:hypothetical protein n=1 Tax=Salinactinospora qingdaonensis TaxID=702744 RepID=UPI0031E65A02